MKIDIEKMAYIALIETQLKEIDRLRDVIECKQNDFHNVYLKALRIIGEDKTVELIDDSMASEDLVGLRKAILNEGLFE